MKSHELIISHYDTHFYDEISKAIFVLVRRRIASPSRDSEKLNLIQAGNQTLIEIWLNRMMAKLCQDQQTAICPIRE